MRRLRCVLTVALIPLFVGVALAQSERTPPRLLTRDETVAGITKITVVVDLADTPVRKQMEPAELRTKVEQRLREAGFLVSPADNSTFAETGGPNSVPVLRLKIGGVPHTESTARGYCADRAFSGAARDPWH